MKILSMKTTLSSSQKPNKFALQPIKACISFEHFQLGYRLRQILSIWVQFCSTNLSVWTKSFAPRSCHGFFYLSDLEPKLFSVVIREHFLNQMTGNNIDSRSSINS